MFAGLRHDAFIRRNDQHDHVHARGPGHHVFDKAFVTGHVHNAQTFAVRQVQPGKAQLNGDAPAFFLFQAVAVLSRESAHQRGLAVVDMPGRTQYYCHEKTSFRRGCCRKGPQGLPALRLSVFLFCKLRWAAARETSGSPWPVQPRPCTGPAAQIFTAEGEASRARASWASWVTLAS